MTAFPGIGFSSYAGDDPDFEHLRRDLDEAGRLGAAFVELPLFTMDVIAGGRILRGQLDRVKQALAGRGLRYTIHGPIAANFMQPQVIAARHMAVAKATIEASAELGAVHVVLHTGYLKEQAEAGIEAAYAAQRKALTALGDFAAQHGIVLVIENIFVSDAEEHTALPSRLAEEIVTIGHPHVRACLDFSHAFITCTARGANFLEEARALARVAKHLHIHDSFGDPTRIRTFSRSERVAYGLGDLHLPIGWGSIPWDEIMATFAFEADVMFNLELPEPYRFALADNLTAMRRMAATYQAQRQSS